MGAKMTVQTTQLGDTLVGKFIGVKTLSTEECVDEALQKGYVVGKAGTIISYANAVIKSMAAAISRDGNGRKVDGYFSIQPSVRCKLADNCEPVKKENVTAWLNTRVLSAGDIDTSDWSITVEGASSSMVINSITTGEEMGEVVIGEAIDFNGVELNVPTTATLSWVANDGTQQVTGSISSADRTCNAFRITTTANVLSTLTGSTWEGKEIVFTLHNGSKTAIKTAVLRVAQ